VQVAPKSKNDYWAFSACVDTLVCTLGQLPLAVCMRWRHHIIEVVLGLVQSHGHEYRLYTLACAVTDSFLRQDTDSTAEGGHDDSIALDPSIADADRSGGTPEGSSAIASLVQHTVSCLFGFQGMVLHQALRFLFLAPIYSVSSSDVQAAIVALLGAGGSAATENPELVVLALDMLERRVKVDGIMGRSQLAGILPLMMKLLDSEDGDIRHLAIE